MTEKMRWTLSITIPSDQTEISCMPFRGVFREEKGTKKHKRL